MFYTVGPFCPFKINLIPKSQLALLEPESIVLDTEYREFYVEIRVDRKSVHVTRAEELLSRERRIPTTRRSPFIKQASTVPETDHRWSIVPKASGFASQTPGYIDVAITTLLAACADDLGRCRGSISYICSVVSLEIVSTTSQVIVGMMGVKLREGSGHDTYISNCDG
jgi:hypothetical protein